MLGLLVPNVERFGKLTQMMTNEQVINELLNVIFVDHLNIRKWLYGYNTHFEMSPDEMIKSGRSEEVIGYLVWFIDGPY